MSNIKKPIDYYDRIADALEIIAGDDSHINDEYPTMDYYDRIATALQIISEIGISTVRAQSHIIASKTQPTNQIAGDIWLIINNN